MFSHISREAGAHRFDARPLPPKCWSVLEQDTDLQNSSRNGMVSVRMGIFKNDSS